MAERRVVLRPATSSDRDFAFHAWKTSMKHYIEATWGWDEEAQMQRQHEEFAKWADPHYQIVELAGQPIGTLIVNRHLDHIYLSGLYLLPEYQRQGFGSQILNDLLLEAQLRKVPIRLRVLNVNSQARRLYERLGFAVADESQPPFMLMEAEQ